MKTLILDTEFTALPINFSYEHIDLLELGYIVIDDKFNIIKEVNLLVNVPFQISEDITKLTGIDNEKSKDGLYILDVLNIFYNDLKQCQYIVGQNIKCDIGVLLNEYTRLKLQDHIDELNKKIRLDSYYIFRDHINLNSYKLINIYNYIHNTNLKQTHRALDDCHLILSSFKKLNSITSIQSEFFKYKFPFGKHKLKSYEQIRNDDYIYYIWILQSMYKLDENIIKNYF